MKKFIRILISTLLIILIAIPFSLIPIVMLCLPSQNDGVFTHALSDKLSRLESIEEDKIVIVGGSSTAFGYDSEMIEKYTGMPVVNMGVYAALGTKIMLELTEPYIKEGDVVILAPELDSETLSMYFGAEEALSALDGNYSYLLDIDSEHYTELLGASFAFSFKKLGYFFTEAPSPEGIYNSQSFDEYGDIEYERTENVMQLYYDPNAPIEHDGSILDSEFCDSLGAYINACKGKGAEVFFTYCPMNKLGVKGGYDYGRAMAFDAFLRDSIDCEFIGYAPDYVYEAGYFYDTNFHLNDTGAVMHTSYVLMELMPRLGIDTGFGEDIPDPPPLPEIDVKFFGEDENAKYFTYKKTASGAYMITGVKDEYKSEKELTVPLGYNGYKVMQIGAKAFMGTSLQKLTLSEGTDSFLFANGAFYGASNLTSLVILHPYAVDIAPPADFVGVAGGFKVYVPQGSDYREDYYWRELGLDFEYIG